MKVLICGDRNWDDYSKILKRIVELPRDAIIIEGGARGADSMAGAIARGLAMPFMEFPANWTKYGKAAGPIRNRQMLDERPDLVIAFHHDLSTSRGTADTVREAKRRGIPVEVIS